MDSLLDQVQGKIFSYCDMSTKKMVRCVSHSCGLDIDVFTGLSIIIDDRQPESIQFAQSVRVNKMLIRNVRDVQKKKGVKDNCWLYSPSEFPTVHHVSLLGHVHWKWIEDTLTNFSNLTSILMTGPALDVPIFPYGRTDFILFPKVRIFEINSAWAKSNILHPRERRQIFPDSLQNPTLDEDDEEDFEDHFKYFDEYDVEKGHSSRRQSQKRKYSYSTPVADNIYQLLSIILAPKLIHFRLSYDEDLYNIGYLNWKDIPLREFLCRHSATLEEVIFDGEQNDMTCPPLSIPSSDLKSIPIHLKYLFLSVVDVKNSINNINNSKNSSGWSIKNLFTSSSSLMKNKSKSSNLWNRLLSKQRSLETLNCTIYADWAWSTLTKTMTRNAEFLQVINIGINWTDVSVPMNMNVIGQCLFLRKLSFNSMTQDDPNNYDDHEEIDVEKRCRITHLSALVSCPLLESVFITSALCETDDLDIFTSLPSLTSLVLLYVGRMNNYGVSVGNLEEFLHIRTLNLLIVVEFYRQKHSLHTHRLKKILRSGVNTTDCPILPSFVPYSCPGKFVYIGNIDELSKDHLSNI